MKLIVTLAACIMLACSLQAQQDSTFVRYYYPTTQTHPAWDFFPITQTLAANVFETYDGSFALQALATYHSPPPEWVFPQSPMMLYSRNGEYQNTLFGPQIDGDIVEGYYTRIVKDGHGGYLALDSHYHQLHKLDGSLQFVESITLTCEAGVIDYLRDILPIDNGFIAVGRVDGANLSGFIKFNYSFLPQWVQLVPVSNPAFLDVIQNSDNNSLMWYGGYSYFNVLKGSATGDTLWTKTQLTPSVSSIVEINDRYYGLRYEGVDLNGGHLLVYDFGIDFAIEHPDNPFLTIPTYRLLAEDVVFPTIRTSGNCIVMGVSTPTGEIHKFDSNFNLLWSSNALPPERIGIGKQPLIELGDSDILYCARIMYGASTLTERLAIVRIDSNGNYVGIVDEHETTPPVSCISAYPNPFSTEITLSIKRRALPTSKFIIYNIKGQQVESIDINDKAVTWTPKDIPSGLYIVKLAEGSKTVKSHLISYVK